MDLSCPWSAIALANLAAAAELAPAIEVDWAFSPVIVEAPAPAGDAPAERGRLRYGDPAPLSSRIDAAARGAGLVMRSAEHTRPVSTVRAHTLLREARGLDALRFARAVFEARFRDGRDISAMDVLLDVAAPCGFARDKVLRILETPRALYLTRQAARVVGDARGLSAPTAVFDGRIQVAGPREPHVFRAAMQRALAEQR